MKRYRMRACRVYGDDDEDWSFEVWVWTPEGFGQPDPAVWWYRTPTERGTF